MAAQTLQARRPRTGTISRIETDPSHHLTGPFLPQTPLDALDSPFDVPAPRIPSPPRAKPLFASKNGTPTSEGLLRDLRTWRWVVVPSSSLKLLLIPVVLHLQWILITPLVLPDAPPSPFAPMLFISHPTPSPTGDDVNDPRYRKGYLDLVFLAYHIILWSFVRQLITIRLCRPVAQYFGLKKETKLERFGEQGYAMIYFAFFGLWGMRIMAQLPTWWYQPQYFWIDYPHWQMKPELKRYYLMQAAYWCQQLIVLLFKLEKPRKDYNELVAHHLVTLWLVGWSYLINLTLIGNAVYTSMDIPDTWLALTKLLNYLRMQRTQMVIFAIFLTIWTYFRHYLNLVMLYSVYKDFDLIPETARFWTPSEGVWMLWWMRWQIFMPILLLQCLNLFWYFLILRIAYRAATQNDLADERSDDEDSDSEDAKAKPKSKAGKAVKTD
ncbi:longevity assurance proteins LAG1/LAC1 [Auriscalpium vulgare]|uniref:Longevity assurance proteins LAG1/LAC1 n=1 Tax=Auriscalpium vulgare TaxID=40419 RepID=A0ACB8SBH4_9AGAM|nr:longevity assurance proteins LAG1/LAC1 [Auriscalpium vulgare]